MESDMESDRYIALAGIEGQIDLVFNDGSVL